MADSLNISPRLGIARGMWSLGLLVACIFVMGCPAPHETSPETSPQEHVSPAEQPDEVAAATEQEVPEDAVPGHVRVRTIYADGAAEAERALYRVHTPDGESVRSASRSSNFELPPGRYEISVQVGNATAVGSVDVVSEELVEVELVLDAGVLRLATYLVEDGEPAPNPLYRVLSTESDIQGRRETVVSPTRSSTFTLPAGSYILRVSEGNTTVDQEVSIEAGERHEVDIVLNAGLLVGSAVEEDGTEAERALWHVLTVGKDITGQRETVAGPTRSSQFMLPQGDYVLRVTAGGRVEDQTVTVAAGERKESRLVMPRDE